MEILMSNVNAKRTLEPLAKGKAWEFILHFVEKQVSPWRSAFQNG